MNTPSLALQLARNIPELIAFVDGIALQGGVTSTLNRIAGAGFVPTTGAPSNASGVNGQYALDVTNSVIYGPKAGGVWPAGVSFKGLAPTFTAGTATTLPSGTPATITVTPTGPNSYSISVGIPRGASGAGTGDLLSTNNLSDLANIATARTNLGLGTLATQNANNVNITGGTVAPSVDIAVADGGTGASSAPAARSNLGIPNFGTAAGNLTPLDSNGYFPASTINPANVVLSVAGLAGSVTAADLRQAAALRPGIEVQAWDADLDAFGAITATNIVYVRTANGVKPATLSGLTIGGTADMPVVTVTTGGREQTLTASYDQDGTYYTAFYYASTAESLSYKVVGGASSPSGSIFKSSAANPTSFATVVTGIGVGTTGSITLEAGATLQWVANGPGGGGVGLHLKRI